MDRRKRTMISHGRMRQTNQTKIVTVKKGNVRETSRRVYGAHDYGLSRAHKYNLVFSERQRQRQTEREREKGTVVFK